MCYYTCGVHQLDLHTLWLLISKTFLYFAFDKLTTNLQSTVSARPGNGCVYQLGHAGNGWVYQLGQGMDGSTVLCKLVGTAQKYESKCATTLVVYTN